MKSFNCKQLLTAANILSSLRIALSLSLLFLKPFSVLFFAVYCGSGLTDIADGFCARRFGTVSDFGARLDTAADTCFVLAVSVKILPIIHLEKVIIIGIVIVALIKILSIIIGFIKTGKYTAVHSVLNKAVGLLLFVFPLTVKLIDVNISSAVLLFISIFAAVEEAFTVIYLSKEKGNE